MKKFLIINPFGIGDVLFTTLILRAIKDNQPDSFIGYWCNERVADILKNNPRIDKLFALSRGDLKRVYHKSMAKGVYKFLNLVYEIKREGFDVSLDVSLDHRYGLISKLSGIKKRIGFNYKRRGLFLTDKIDITGYQDKHIVEYYLELLKLLNISAQDNRLELFIPEEDKKTADNLLKSIGIRNGDLVVGIAAGAGASWGEDAAIKHWPAIKYAQLADNLINDLNAKILLLGDECDRVIADTIVNKMNKKPIDLVGKTRLEELAAIINCLNILITNDGGPLHIAVALHKKTLSFFGPVDPLVYGPYPPDGNRHFVLNRTLNCAPCYKGFHLNPCLRNKECLEKIEVKDALEAVKKLVD